MGADTLESPPSVAEANPTVPFTPDSQRTPPSSADKQLQAAINNRNKILNAVPGKAAELDEARITAAEQALRAQDQPSSLSETPEPTATVSGQAEPTLIDPLTASGTENRKREKHGTGLAQGIGDRWGEQIRGVVKFFGGKREAPPVAVQAPAVQAPAEAPAPTVSEPPIPTTPFTSADSGHTGPEKQGGGSTVAATADTEPVINGHSSTDGLISTGPVIVENPAITNTASPNGGSTEHAGTAKPIVTGLPNGHSTEDTGSTEPVVTADTTDTKTADSGKGFWSDPIVKGDEEKKAEAVAGGEESFEEDLDVNRNAYINTTAAIEGAKAKGRTPSRREEQVLERVEASIDALFIEEAASIAGVPEDTYMQVEREKLFQAEHDLLVDQAKKEAQDGSPLFYKLIHRMQGVAAEGLFKARAIMRQTEDMARKKEADAAAAVVKREESDKRTSDFYTNVNGPAPQLPTSDATIPYLKRPYVDVPQPTGDHIGPEAKSMRWWEDRTAAFANKDKKTKPTEAEYTATLANTPKLDMDNDNTEKNKAAKAAWKKVIPEDNKTVKDAKTSKWKRVVLAGAVAAGVGAANGYFDNQDTSGSITRTFDGIVSGDKDKAPEGTINVHAISPEINASSRLEKVPTLEQVVNMGTPLHIRAPETFQGELIHDSISRAMGRTPQTDGHIMPKDIFDNEFYPDGQDAKVNPNNKQAAQNSFALQTVNLALMKARNNDFSTQEAAQKFADLHSEDEQVWEAAAGWTTNNLDHVQPGDIPEGLTVEEAQQVNALLEEAYKKDGVAGVQKILNEILEESAHRIAVAALQTNTPSTDTQPTIPAIGPDQNDNRLGDAVLGAAVGAAGIAGVAATQAGANEINRRRP
jgi:hypothetical protein